MANAKKKATKKKATSKKTAKKISKTTKKKSTAKKVSHKYDASQSRYKVGIPKFDQAIEKITKDYAPDHPDLGLIREMMVTALKTSRDGLDRGDLKIINTALKEMRYGLKIFTPYYTTKKVAIFGSARTPVKDPDYLVCKEFSRLIVENGWMVITGGANGIMQAGNEGAGREASFGANIRLPFEQDANPIIARDKKLINFKYFFTRKLIFMRESEATVLCPGGFGTHDEAFETLTLVQTGKTDPRPIVALDAPKSTYWKKFKEFLDTELVKQKLVDKSDMELIHYTHDPKDAVKHILKFYRLYHSMRYIGELLVVRVKRPLTKKEISVLNGSFKDIIKVGKIEQSMVPFDDEEDDMTMTHGLPRIAFCFTKYHFSRLRTFIKTLNSFED